MVSGITLQLQGLLLKSLGVGHSFPWNASGKTFSALLLCLWACPSCHLQFPPFCSRLAPVYPSKVSPGASALSSSWPSIVPLFPPLYPSRGLPGWLEVKNPSVNAGDKCSIPGLGRSPGGGHGYPLQYCCLENPMDRGAWWATGHGVAK